MGFESKLLETEYLGVGERVTCPNCGSLLFKLLATTGKSIEIHKCRKCKRFVEVRIF